MKKDHLIKHSTIMLSAAVIGNVLSLFFHMHMARRLPLADYGALLSMLAFFTILGVPLTTIRIVVARYITHYKAKQEHHHVKFILSMMSKRLSLIGLGAFLAVIIINNQLGSFFKLDTNIPIFIFGLLLFLSIATQTFEGTLHGLQGFTQLGISAVVSNVVKVLGGIMLVSLGFGLNGAFSGFLFYYIVNFLIIWFFIKFIFAHKSEDQISINFGEMYKYSIPVAITIFCFMSLTNVDVILVRRFFETGLSGHYSVASMVGKIVLFASSPIALVMFPKTAELHSLDTPSRHILNKCLLITLLISGLAAGICFFAPKFVLTTLYGKKALLGIPIVRPLGFAMLLFSLIYVQLLYNLSVHNSKAVFNLVFFTILEIVAIAVFHSSLMQVALVLAGLTFLLFVTNYYIIFRGRN